MTPAATAVGAVRAPADLDATARAIAGHAITGTHNLAAQVLTSGPRRCTAT